LIEQVPAVTNERRPPVVIVHTPTVLEVNVGIRLELAVALNVGVVPKFWELGLAKVIVWPATGVTAFDAAEACPVPVEFVAVTVKV
jgi:hypothetical protein